MTSKLAEHEAKCKANGVAITDEKDEKDEKKSEEKSIASADIPQRMKGMVQLGYDDDITKIFAWTELPTPQPKDFEVLIKGIYNMSMNTTPNLRT